MNHTQIEWVQNPDGTPGYTWNPITGCLNHTDGLCKGGGFPCYAYRLAHGRLKHLYLANKNFSHSLSASEGQDIFYNFKRETDPFYPRFWPERVLDLTTSRIRKHFIESRGIFVCDMGELFGDWVPEKWQELVFDAIKSKPQHRFYLLTKQPQNLLKFSPFPDNCWVGVTVCTNGAMTLALTNLANIQAKVKFISFEPLLGSIGMSDHMSIKGIVDWAIIGAQTKPAVYPRIEWVKEIVLAADKVGVPVFFKDNLYPLIHQERKVSDRGWLKYYEQGENLRQEMPQ